MLPERRDILRGRRALLLALLDEHLPDWRPDPSKGGMSLWVRLPAPMSTAVSAAASRMGLEIPPGPRFGVDGTLERFIRVPYTLPDEQLTEAIELLARAWRSVTGAGATAPDVSAGGLVPATGFTRSRLVAKVRRRGCRRGAPCRRSRRRPRSRRASRRG